MMLIRSVLFVGLFVFLSMRQSVAQELADMLWITEEFAPLSYSDPSGAVVGIYPEIVQLLWQELGLPASTPIVSMPWARGIKMLNEDRRVLLFPMMMTPQRQKTYYFIGPLPEISDDGIIVTKQQAAKITDLPIKQALNQLELCAIGVTRDSVELQLIRDLVPQHCIKVFDSPQRQVPLLAKGRLGAIATDSVVARWYMKQHGLVPTEFQMTHVLSAGNGGIGVNRAISEATFQQLRSGFQRLVDKRAFAKIKQKYSLQ